MFIDFYIVMYKNIKGFKMKTLLKVILTGMVTLFFTACGGGGGSDTPPPNVTEPTEELASIDIQLEEGVSLNTIGAGMELQLFLYGIYTEYGVADPSNSKLIDGDITWETSDATVATVDSNGMLKAISKGEVLIEANYDGVVTEMSFEIIPAYVQELILTPSEETININVSDILKLTTNGLMTDGTIVPINAMWETRNPAIAMVWGYVINGTSKVGGMVEGFEAGTVTIKASYPQRGDGYYVPTAYGEVTVIVE